MIHTFSNIFKLLLKVSNINSEIMSGPCIAEKLTYIAKPEPTGYE